MSTAQGVDATRSLATGSAEATRAVGARLGRALRPGDVLRLEGDLGAGKTTFVQGVLAALGISGRVTSPTFTLVNEYRAPGGLAVHHMDAYRLGLAAANEQVVDTLGLADLLDDGGALLVEWSERIDALLPAQGLTIRFAYGAGADERVLTFFATGPRAAELLRALD